MSRSRIQCEISVSAPQHHLLSITVAYLHPLVTGLTTLGSVIDAVTQDDSHCRFLRSRRGAGYEEAANMADLFASRSAGGGKRTTVALVSNYALVNKKGAGWMLHIARGGIY